MFATPHLLTPEQDQLRDTRPMKYWLVDGLLDAGKLLVRGDVQRIEGGACDLGKTVFLDVQDPQLSRNVEVLSDDTLSYGPCHARLLGVANL